MLHFKEVIGVAIHIRLRRCSQSDHICIEILKNRSVLFEYAPMAFVDNNQIEVCRAEQALPVFRFYIINGIQDGRICRKDNPCAAIIFVAAQVAKRHIRKIIFEIILCLLHQRSPVSQEQDVCHILASTEDISQAGCRSCLSGTGGHDQQVLAETESDLFADGANGFFLIIAVGDFIVDGNRH